MRGHRNRKRCCFNFHRTYPQLKAKRKTVIVKLSRPRTLYPAYSLHERAFLCFFFCFFKKNLLALSVYLVYFSLYIHLCIFDLKRSRNKLSRQRPLSFFCTLSPLSEAAWAFPQAAGRTDRRPSVSQTAGDADACPGRSGFSRWPSTPACPLCCGSNLRSPPAGSTRTGAE